MANLGVNLAKNIIKYTKNGGRLVSKTSTANTKTAIVETNFGNSVKKIIQDFDDNGKLQCLTITHQDKNGKDLKTLIKTYSRENGQTKIETRNLDSNGAPTGSSSERQIVLNELDGSKSMLRIKFDELSGKATRKEKQAYEHLHNAANKSKNKTLYTEALRLNNGDVLNKKISGNLPNLDEIAKDPYLYIRNYNNKDFAQSASYIAADIQGVPRGKLLLKKLKTCSGYYQPATRKVTIDSSHMKSDIIGTLNHEYRHKYQHAQIRKIFKRLLNIFKSDKKKIIMSDSELKEAKEFFKADVKYIPKEINFKKYYNNFLEVDARKAGEAAKKQYEDYALKLAESFEASNFHDFFDLTPKAISDAILNAIKSCKTVQLGIFDLTKVANM